MPLAKGVLAAGTDNEEPLWKADPERGGTIEALKGLVSTLPGIPVANGNVDPADTTTTPSPPDVFCMRPERLLAGLFGVRAPASNGTPGVNCIARAGAMAMDIGSVRVAAATLTGEKLENGRFKCSRS